MEFAPTTEVSSLSGRPPEVVRLFFSKEQEAAKTERDRLITRTEAFLDQALISPGEELVKIARASVSFYSPDVSPALRRLGRKTTQKAAEIIKAARPGETILNLWILRGSGPFEKAGIHPFARPELKEFFFDAPLKAIKKIRTESARTGPKKAELIDKALEILESGQDYFSPSEDAPTSQAQKETLNLLKEAFPVEDLPSPPFRPMGQAYEKAAALALEFGDHDYARQVYSALFRQGVDYLANQFAQDISRPDAVIRTFPRTVPNYQSYSDQSYSERVAIALARITEMAVKASLLGAIDRDDIQKFIQVRAGQVQPALLARWEGLANLDVAQEAKRPFRWLLGKRKKEKIREESQRVLVGYCKKPADFEFYNENLERELLEKLGRKFGKRLRKVKDPVEEKDYLDYVKDPEEKARIIAERESEKRRQRLNDSFPPIDMRDGVDHFLANKGGRITPYSDPFWIPLKKIPEYMRKRDALVLDRILLELSKFRPDPLSAVLPIDSDQRKKRRTEIARQKREKRMVARNSQRLLLNQPHLRLHFTFLKLACLDAFAREGREKMDADFYLDRKFLCHPKALFPPELKKFPKRLRYLVEVLETNPFLPPVEINQAEVLADYLQQFHALAPTEKEGAYSIFPDRFFCQLFDCLPDEEKEKVYNTISPTQIAMIPHNSQFALKMAGFILSGRPQFEAASAAHGETLLALLQARKLEQGEHPHFAQLTNALKERQIDLVLSTGGV